MAKQVSRKSREYWRKRFKILEKTSHEYGLEVYSAIEPAFLKAQRNIQKELEYWLIRFARNNQISMQEARKMLTNKELRELKWEVEEYIQHGRENALSKKWMKELENASARYHISRLEALKLSTQQAIEIAFGNQLDKIDRMAKRILTEDYYKTIYELQKGFRVGHKIAEVNQRKLDKLVTKPWTTDKRSFSDRIWTQKEQMIGELHQELVRTCLQGKAPGEAIKNMTKYVDTKFKKVRYAASRLVQTEQAYFHAVSQQEAYEELDIEKYQIIATLDDKTSEICQEMDLKVFPMKEYEAGVTAPPFHPNCRSATMPYDEEYTGTRRAARGGEGKTYYIPANMTYREWKKTMVKTT